MSFIDLAAPISGVIPSDPRGPESVDVDAELGARIQEGVVEVLAGGALAVQQVRADTFGEVVSHDVIAEAPEGREHLLTVDIDIAEVRRRRCDIPLVKEARLELIRREIERLLAEGGDL